MLNDEVAPVGVDISKPSVARVYDYMLGGKDNFAVDRMAGERALAVTPDGPEAAVASRAFLRRAVRYLAAEVGIRQFLDVGSGLPTQGNVHEIAHLVDPRTRVVYVDNDPMVLAHGRALLAEQGTTTVIQADVRRPQDILQHSTVAQFLDFDQPIGLLMLGILHHVNDHEDPNGIAATMRGALPSGSYLALSHFRNPGEAHPEVSAKAEEVERIFNQTLGTGRWRRQAEILGYFGDFSLLEPGVVPLADWRPDPRERRPKQTDTYLTFVGGVARKP